MPCSTSSRAWEHPDAPGVVLTAAPVQDPWASPFATTSGHSPRGVCRRAAAPSGPAAGRATGASPAAGRATGASRTRTPRDGGRPLDVEPVGVGEDVGVPVVQVEPAVLEPLRRRCGAERHQDDIGRQHLTVVQARCPRGRRRLRTRCRADVQRLATRARVRHDRRGHRLDDAMEHRHKLQSWWRPRSSETTRS